MATPASRRGLLLAAPALLLGLRAAPAAALECDGRERDYFGNATLTDQEGRQVRFYDDVLRGRTVLIGWIFTSCPDACPLLAARSLEIADAAAAAGAPPRILHLTTDPRRDTPARLKSWAARFGRYEDWVLLTGTPAGLRDVARRLGQTVDEERPDRHTTLMLAGNVGARRWAKLRPDLQPAAAGAQLADLAGAPRLVDAATCAG
ncbi:SCO family protein [Muricoccus pecuniae]|uniref:Cytochrome oxidase Cu insertion factor (SCO1/SenC/PrrC family) n=1 Tax=Muricoccus pecuniae TaxID=693023 RepID=A0A840XX42_9PROT|nr:SCO family protein [Roseomonas pecuniae]MBB5693065.1 cytochrome oxidase Cu insertion factor (SCO1/SenC/PrrC family) [Roseomonas pecuniae]